MADLSVNIGDLKLCNPVMTASGTFGYGKERDRKKTACSSNVRYGNSVTVIRGLPFGKVVISVQARIFTAPRPVL